MKKLILTLAILGCVVCFFAFNNNEFYNLPKGTIMGWGSANAIPKGWTICDGRYGTPDLINRIPYGTRMKSEIGQKIGNEKHRHTVSGVTEVNNFVRQTGGDVGIHRNGDNEWTHNHKFSAFTDSVSSIPPCTKIIFIMKI